MTPRPNMLDLEAMCSATLGIVSVLMNRLLKKGALSVDDVNEIFDALLAPHELLQHANDPVSLRIRRLGDELTLAILEVPRSPRKPQSE